MPEMTHWKMIFNLMSQLTELLVEEKEVTYVDSKEEVEEEVFIVIT